MEVKVRLWSLRLDQKRKNTNKIVRRRDGEGSSSGGGGEREDSVPMEEGWFTRRRNQSEYMV